MITANMATFPPRSEGLRDVVARILPQVDQLNIVFNEYDKIPEEYQNTRGLTPIIPHEDTKDVGKFYPDVSKSDYVLFVDDDVDYPDDYVSETVEKFECLPAGRFLGGYHTSIYRKPELGASLYKTRRYALFFLSPNRIAEFRKVYTFRHDLDVSIFVDQVATNSAIIRGEDMPPYTYMRDSQKFVDVRLALWCFEQGIETIALPRKCGWLSTEPDDNSIYLNFTQKHHRYVARDIWKFAFKKPHVGRELDVDRPDLRTGSMGE